MKKKAITFFTVLISTNITVAQTNIGGGIFSNTTWTLTASPYLVTDSITVFPGVTLIIEPGTEIQFNDNTYLEIRGKLIAVGTVMDTIIFTSSSNSPNYSSWEGIGISTGIDTSLMRFCKVSYSKGVFGLKSLTKSVFLNNYRLGGSNIIDSCIFQNGIYGIWGGQISNSTFINFTSYALDVVNGQITNCKFFNNGIASEGVNGTISNSIFCGNWLAIQSGATLVQNCIISYNDYGIAPDIGPVTMDLQNSELSYNKVGIYINNQVSLTNNNICNNIEYGVKLGFSSNIDLSNNCWCTNDSALIAQQIYDGYDDVSLGLVNFSPSINCDSTAIPDTIYCDTNNIVISIKKQISNSKRFHLLQNIPNPFSSKTTISFQIYSKGEAILKIYDIQGSQVALLLNKKLSSNKYEIEFNAQNLPSGIYYYQLQTDTFIESKKMILIK